MGNLITHNGKVGERQVQAYATNAETIALDMNHQLTDDGAPFYELPLIEALALVRLVEAAIRDAQQGTFQS